MRILVGLPLMFGAILFAITDMRGLVAFCAGWAFCAWFGWVDKQLRERGR